MIGHDFPYLDTRDLNLDWILRTIKKVIADWMETREAFENLQAAFDDLKKYVDDYFDSLDVRDAISDKLDEMYQDGRLASLIQNMVIFHPATMLKFAGERGWNNYQFGVQGFCLCGNGMGLYYTYKDSVGIFKKIDLETGEIIEEHDLYIGHGNDVTYDPDNELIWAVDGNTNEIFKIDGSNFELLNTATIDDYKFHGIANKDANTLYVYSYWLGNLILFEMDKTTYELTTVFDTTVRNHTYQGLCTDGRYFYIVCQYPGTIARFDRDGNDIVTTEFEYFDNDLFIGEMQSIDFDSANGDFVVMARYQDFSASARLDGIFSGTQTNVITFGRFNPYQSTEALAWYYHNVSDLVLINLFVDAENAPFRPSGAQTAPFSTFTEAAAFRRRQNMMKSIHIDALPEGEDCFLVNDNVIITSKVNCNLQMLGCKASIYTESGASINLLVNKCQVTIPAGTVLTADTDSDIVFRDRRSVPVGELALWRGGTRFVEMGEGGKLPLNAIGIFQIQTSGGATRVFCFSASGTPYYFAAIGNDVVRVQFASDGGLYPSALKSLTSETVYTVTSWTLSILNI